MNFTLTVTDSELDKAIKAAIDSHLTSINLEALIEAKVNSRIDKFLSSHVSPEKIDNMARDRVSRILTSESLKDYTTSLEATDITSNLEAKILLMIEKSPSFKKLVKETLKNSL